MDFFGVDVPGIIGDVLGPEFPAATLTKVTPSEEGSGSDEPDRRDFPCKALVSDYSETFVALNTSLRGRRRVLILSATLDPTAVPEPGDEVTATDGTGVARRYTIADGGVSFDALGAVYECGLAR